MSPLFLITIFSLFAIYSIRIMFKRGHDLHGLGFLTLFIYTIFTQIGYVYFPELSTFIGAYYGQELFYKYWAFMFFSFIFTFFLYMRFNPIKEIKETYLVKPSRNNLGEYFFFLFAIVLFTFLSIYFVLFREFFGYGGGTSMGGPWFGIGFWIYSVCLIVLFSLFRDKSNKLKKRIFSLMLFVIFLIFYLQVSIASGNRSAILYLFVGLAVFEFFPIIKKIKIQKRKIFIGVLVAIFVLSIMSSLRTARSLGDQIGFLSLIFKESDQMQNLDNGFMRSIILQDYFVPSHTLFVSMEYKIVDPLEVIKSNLANSLVLLKYPFLTTTIIAEEKGEASERGVGWAYHYFVEGYNFMGMFGVLYNALFWNLGLLLWYKLAQSNNSNHNRVMLSIASLLIISTMRGQTSSFIQFYWMILLPGLALTLLANNSTFALFKRRKYLINNE